MTTNPTPEQLLAIAKICEPDVKWVVGKDGEVVLYGELKVVDVFDPLNDLAQLMQVVFAIAKKLNDTDNGDHIVRLYNALHEENKQSIISLAIEVLL